MVTRFILLCQPRTGSSELIAALRQHPEVSVYDEILDPRQSAQLPDDGRLRIIAALGSRTGGAVGCKIHAYQPLRDRHVWHWEEAWQQIEQDATIRIIVLRRDALSQYVALKLAMTNHDWTGESESQRDNLCIRRDEFYWFKRWNELAYDCRLARLRGHAKIELTLDQLANDWNTTMAAVCCFLKISAFTFRNGLWRRDLRSLVQNAELLDAVS